MVAGYRPCSPPSAQVPGSGGGQSMIAMDECAVDQESKAFLFDAHQMISSISHLLRLDEAGISGDSHKMKNLKEPFRIMNLCRRSFNDATVIWNRPRLDERTHCEPGRELQPVKVNDPDPSRGFRDSRRLG